MRNLFIIAGICFVSLAFSVEFKPFELIGVVKTQQGFVIPDTYVQIWEQGEVIAQTKTKNDGTYTLPIPKIGEFTVMVGNKNEYFHPKKIEAFNFHTSTQFEKNFTLELDEQELKEECVRLRETYRHMVHNPKNMSYRRIFIQRFPRSGLELEIFFSKDVDAENLQKEARRYLHTLFEYGLLSRTTYFLKFIQFSQHTDMRFAEKQTQKFYGGAVEIIKKHPADLFKELSQTKPKKVSNFFLWMFSGGEFGTKKMTTEFDFLLEKYPTEYALMVKAFETYKNGN